MPLPFWSAAATTATNSTAIAYDGVPTGEDSTDGVFNPRLGLRYRLAPAASLYATAGSAYVPAMNILKFRSGPTWLDNPGLKPETSTSYEVGGNYRKGSVNARAAVYHTNYKDKIERITVGARTSSPTSQR